MYELTMDVIRAILRASSRPQNGRRIPNIHSDTEGIRFDVSGLNVRITPIGIVQVNGVYCGLCEMSMVENLRSIADSQHAILSPAAPPGKTFDGFLPPLTPPQQDCNSNNGLLRPRTCPACGASSTDMGLGVALGTDVAYVCSSACAHAMLRGPDSTAAPTSAEGE